MTRHAWLPIVLAALFGLRGPLCLYACGEPSAASPVAATEAPCHGGGEAPVGAKEPAEHECDCDETDVLVSSVAAKEAASPPEAVVASPALVARAAPRAAVAMRAPHPSPPPRDLLLLNATLLL